MDHRVVSNTLYQVAQKICTALVTLVTTVFVARTLGVSGYGSFTQITAIAGMFFLIVDFGMNAIVLHEDVHRSFGALLLARLFLAIGSFLAISCLVLLLPFNSAFGIGFSPTVKTGMLIYSGIFFSQAFLFSATAVFQKELRYSSLLITSCAGSFVTAALVYIAFVYQLSLLFIVGSFVTGSFVSAIGAFIFVFPRVSTEPNLQRAKGLIGNSLPLGLMLIFNLVYFRIDIFLLSLFKSAADVGIYGLSYRFFDFLIALPLFLSNSLYPILVENQKNLRKNAGVVLKYTAVSMVLGSVLAVFLWFLAPFITLVRQDFIGAVASFRLLLLSLPFFFGTSLLQWGIIAEKRHAFLMWVYLGSAILNIVLNIFLIPSGSYLASAVITGVTEAIVFIVLASYFYLNFFRSET